MKTIPQKNGGTVSGERFMAAAVEESGSVRVAEIAVDQAAYHFDKLYTLSLIHI